MIDFLFFYEHQIEILLPSHSGELYIKWKDLNSFPDAEIV
jgi:hypothetical protein